MSWLRLQWAGSVAVSCRRHSANGILYREKPPGDITVEHDNSKAITEQIGKIEGSHLSRSEHRLQYSVEMYIAALCYNSSQRCIPGHLLIFFMQ